MFMGLATKMESAVRKIRLSSGPAAPYRFVVRKWAGLSDLDLAADILGTEFFRAQLEPVELPVKEIKSILVLAPHQDDETIGAGGTLLMAAALGTRIDVVYVTDGASGHRGNDWTRMRDEEAEKVCERIGARVHRLGISNVTPRPDESHLDELSGLIDRLKPQVLMVPWLLDSPPKHRLANHLLWLAYQRRPWGDCEVWGYQVHNALVPNGYVDITGVIDRKRELLECFKTQNENWTCYTHLALGMAAWNMHYIRSTRPRFLEVFTALPMGEMFKLVEQFYFKDLARTYRGDRKTCAGALTLHQRVTERRQAGKGWVRGIARWIGAWTKRPGYVRPAGLNYTRGIGAP